MSVADLFDRYRSLTRRADVAFESMAEEYGHLMKCRLHCSDCCQAIFGLFLVEAAVVRESFENLAEDLKKAALRRADKAEKDLDRIQERLKIYADDPAMKAYALSKERVRCPLLDEAEECIIYNQRPITCRVYGIPTAIHGRGQVCGKAEFKRGEAHPTFNLDAVYQELYKLSKEMLMKQESGNMEKASLLISLSLVLRTPNHKIMQGEIE